MKDLTQGSVVKHLLHMSSFMAVSMVVQTLYLLLDMYWVGHLGKEAIAAVGVAGNLNMIVLALTQMLGVGTTALISQAAGRKDQPRAELIFNQSCVMSIFVGLFVGICVFASMGRYTNSLSADAVIARSFSCVFTLSQQTDHLFDICRVRGQQPDALLRGNHPVEGDPQVGS